MARCILLLALCSTFGAPLVWSRRISHDSKVASASMAPSPQDTIFVNGLEFGTDEDALKQHFGVVGAIKDLHFQSRGSAVITYEEPSAATRAVNELHETTLAGQSRYVAVKLDEPQQPREGEKAKVKGKGKDKVKKEHSGPRDSRPAGRTIFVHGLDPQSDDASLIKYFGKVGAIEHHHFQSKVAAVIVYAEASAAQEAIASLNGLTMNGSRRYMDVRLDNSD